MAGHTVFTRSDGEIFHLKWRAGGHASLFHHGMTSRDGIGLDFNVADKAGEAEKLILRYPVGWH